MQDVRQTLRHLMEGEVKMRTFDFNAPVAYGAALEVIDAALEDEGLALFRGDNARTRVFSTLETVAGRPIERYHVPEWRIIPRTIAPEDAGLAPGEITEVYGR